MSPAKKADEFWRGQTDAKLEAVSTAVNEVKLTMTRVEEKLDALRLWKAKVVGISAAISSGVAILARLLH